MVKIISKKSIGTQDVYDIGVEKDHNFTLENSLVASNCFNKSHSMAYAYITYQTAYLKANYPVEYMAALLTANRGDQEKVQKYIANCLKLGIEVEPPDINSSELTFTPLPKEMTKAEKSQILFGISAVKNVGEGAIENILAARKEGGKFKSLPDLCDRVNLHSVNRRALEALIQCGAFDKIDNNRQQLVNDLEGVIKWAQDRKKDRESGQGNLFDLLGGMSFGQSVNKYESAPKSKIVKDFDKQEKLRLEKELLGFYVSEHPLKNFLQMNQDPDVVTLEQLADKKGKVSVIVTISAIKPVVTKKGEKMAILQLEDLTHQIKAVVFPKTYEQVCSHITDNAVLLISGKIEKDGEEIQIIVDDAKPIKAVDMAEEIQPLETEESEVWLPEPVKIVQVAESVKVLQMVIVKFTIELVKDTQRLKHLKALLQEFSNPREAASVCVGGIVVGKYSCQPVKFNRQLWVQNGEETVSCLKSAHFDAAVFPVNNHLDFLVFLEIRQQLNLHSWASRLLEADRDRISQYLNYLTESSQRLDPPF